MNCKPDQEMKAKVKAMSDPTEAGCWIWSGWKHQKGYGRMWWNGRLEQAHRMAYQAWKGAIPVGMHVLHSCDNPSCVNPVHLFVGTNQENVDDKLRKGRLPRGELRKNAKLTDAAVVAIRESGLTHAALSRQYGVCAKVIREVRQGKRWPHIRPGDHKPAETAATRKPVHGGYPEAA